MDGPWDFTVCHIFFPGSEIHTFLTGDDVGRLTWCHLEYSSFDGVRPYILFPLLIERGLNITSEFFWNKHVPEHFTFYYCFRCVEVNPL